MILRALAVAFATVFAPGAAFAQSNNQFSPDFKPESLYQGTDNSQKDWVEGETKLPAYPKPENLLGYEVVSIPNFRFFVDSESISPGADGIVRFTLVARSRSGAETVSFNGFRCKTDEQKVYATGRTADKTWAETRDSQWKVVESKAIMRQNLALMRDFFCPGRVAIMTRGEGIDALKRGYHPNALSNQSQTR